MAEIQLTDEIFDKEVIQSAQPVLVDFWAPWCGPCRMLAPLVEELAKEYAGKIKVAKINTDEHPNAAGRFKISAIPTLLFFKGGKVAEQMVGVHSKAEIKKTLDSLLAAV
ncbi:MAG: thioredoxin [Elusimicrobia bacterium]|nr:thioredoxin [Elusimicrobiota bacterium]